MLSRRRLAIAVVHDRDTDVELAATDVASALRERGHVVEVVGLEGSLADLQVIGALRVDLVFNLCEGPLVLHVCELVKLPCTGSGPLGLQLALRRDLSRVLLGAAGVPVASGVVLSAPRSRLPLGFPRIVKAASGGTEPGVVVHDEKATKARVAALLEAHDGPVLVEELVPGREVHVSLVGTPLQPLPPHEVDLGGVPAELTRTLRTTLYTLAVRAAETLGLRDHARVDFRIDGDQPCVIDVHASCELSAGGGVAQAARLAGWTHAELIERICLSALTRADRP